MKLIDKDKVVAEIERRRDLHYKYYMKNGVGSIAECKYDEDMDILSFLYTLEEKEVPIWEKVSPDTGQTTLYKDGGKSYLEHFGYRIDLKDLDKLPKKNLKAQKGE